MPSINQLPLDFSLQNSFSFDDYVVADVNVELVTLLKSRTELTEPFYFIWGSEGVGKSHLLQSLCQSRENAVYVPLKRFAEQGVDILQGLQHMDVVCLDDIENVLGKRDWEEGLFEFFNEIREQGNTLLISALSSPRYLTFSLPDLGSRLSWGAVYHLHELEDADKAEALRRRVEGQGIPLNAEVLDYILLRSPRNMAALFNVLETLDKLSLAEKRRVTIPFVKAMMGW